MGDRSAGEFLLAERATAQNQAFGVPDGSFRIVDEVHGRWDRPTIETMAAADGGVAVAGRLRGRGEGIGYRLGFEAVAADQLRFTVGVDGACPG